MGVDSTHSSPKATIPGGIAATISSVRFFMKQSFMALSMVPKMRGKGPGGRRKLAEIFK